MEIVALDIDLLQAHPGNANVMTAETLAKLQAHLARTGRYPPVIVRPRGTGYEILDGHHRVQALRNLGQTQARCVVWDVDDHEALVLLATLNRLQGQDDPRRRAELLARLAESGRQRLAELSAWLPETAGELERLDRLRVPPAPRPPRPLDDWPVCVHFFLKSAERRLVEQRLAALGGTRESALLKLCGQPTPTHAVTEVDHG